MNSYILYISLILTILSVSCDKQRAGQYKFPQDTLISSKNGMAKNYLVNYYPSNLRINDFPENQKINSELAKIYSIYLFAAEEPVLYNFYLGRDVYRLSIVESRGYTRIFTLNSENGKHWLVQKKIIKQPPIELILDLYSSKSGTIDSLWIDTVNSLYGIDIENMRYYKKSGKKITDKEWRHFKKILADFHFEKIEPIQDYNGKDGAVWILEIHQDNKYWVINQWEPEETNEQMYRLGSFILNLSEGL